MAGLDGFEFDGYGLASLHVGSTVNITKGTGTTNSRRDTKLAFPNPEIHIKLVDPFTFEKKTAEDGNLNEELISFVEEQPNSTLN